MTGAAMGLSVVLAAHFAGSTAGALAARAAWAVRGRGQGTAAARRLLRVRLAPTALGAALALGVVAPAFFLFEPRNAGERMTLSLGLLALGGLALVATAVTRVLRELVQTRRLVRGWERTARPVPLPACPVPAFSVATVFPVVAVTGVVRPRLFVSAALLRRLTPAELSAVVGHEIGHLRARDNLKRLLLRACVDVFAWTGWGPELDERWHEAVEDAADDHAVRGSGAARLDLADALLKVARLSGSLDLACPASALFRGERVARRVRRLLADPCMGPARTAPVWQAAVPGAAALAAAFTLATTSPAVHAFFEKVVRALP
ncbi:MAG: M56 family peptidase [Acidobacteria bacterium]|nr:MAG: M56 family peptidase [Acidobacteriota bacterium]